MDFYRRDLCCDQDDLKLAGEVGEVDLTADKLHRDMACRSSSNDLLSSVWVDGVLPFCGLAACSSEHQERVDVGVLRRGEKEQWRGYGGSIVHRTSQDRRNPLLV